MKSNQAVQMTEDIFDGNLIIHYLLIEKFLADLELFYCSAFICEINGVYAKNKIIEYMNELDINFPISFLRKQYFTYV